MDSVTPEVWGGIIQNKETKIFQTKENICIKVEVNKNWQSLRPQNFVIDWQWGLRENKGVKDDSQGVFLKN